MFFEKASRENILNGFTDRDGFIFTSLTAPTNVHDAIVIHVPQTANCLSPKFPHSSKSLDEHLSLIQSQNLEKAIVICEGIEWLPQCASLRFLWIIPALTAPSGFDFSPLYQMACVKWLRCQTIYGMREERHGDIDYALVPGLRCLYVMQTKHELNFNKTCGLQSLSLSNYKEADLSCAFCSEELDWISLSNCKIASLDGLSNAKNLKSISLSHNRCLADISALSSVKGTLFQLCIENCSRITDFSALATLSKLEYLELQGNNTLPSLEFLRNMPNLKVLNLSMNVADGNLSLCMQIPYATCKNRKHFNPKDADLPKQLPTVRDDHGIALWRRC